VLAEAQIKDETRNFENITSGFLKTSRQPEASAIFA